MRRKMDRGNRKGGKEGGRKSFRFEELNPAYIMPRKNNVFVPYLDMIQRDLDDREADI